jgi:hypothetical protein
MPRSPKDSDSSERALFKLAQELGDDEEEVAQAPSWEESKKPAEPLPDDLFQKAYDELTTIFVHLRSVMPWPAYEAPWHKQREKVLVGYGMTVDGFYNELWRRKAMKPGP